MTKEKMTSNERKLVEALEALTLYAHCNWEEYARECAEKWPDTHRGHSGRKLVGILDNARTVVAYVREGCSE